MGRKLLDRHCALYTRITKENEKFLKRTCKKAGLNKTEYIDKHLAFLRNTVTPEKAATQIGTKA